MVLRREIDSKPKFCIKRKKRVKFKFPTELLRWFAIQGPS